MPHTELDTCGLLCPLPVLKLRKVISTLHPGDRVILLADDPAAQIDVPHYCNESGNVLISAEQQAEHWRYEVEVSAP